MEATKTHLAGERTRCESCGGVLDNGHGKDLGDLLVCDVCYRNAARRAANRTHTPGPWGIGHAGYSTTIEDEFGNTIAELNNYGAAFLPAGRVAPHHVTEENARLIAAAPSLLAALETLLGRMESAATQGHAESVKALMEHSDFPVMARLAIAKAKGGAA